MHALLDWLATLPPALTVFVISMLPILELRGSIPYGLLATTLPPWLVIILSIAGTWLVGPLLYLATPVLINICRHVGWFDRFWTYFSEHSRRRIHRTVERQGALGLIIFIGIPLPGFGVVTGALGAYLLGMSFKRFMWVALAGVIMAAAIVTAVVYSGSGASHWLINTDMLKRQQSSPAP